MNKKFQILVNALTLLMSGMLFAQSTTYNSSGTFTVPPGVKSITIDAWGAGGGGGGSLSSSNNSSGGGGGGGAFTRNTFNVTAGETYTITVGNGGVGTGGVAGGNTSVILNGSTIITANGGAGGALTGASGAGGAAAATGLIKFAGGNGGTGAGSGAGINFDTGNRGGAGGGGSAGSGGSGGTGNSATGNTGGTGGSAGSGGGGAGGSGGDRQGLGGTADPGLPGETPGGGGGGRSHRTGTASGGTGGNGRVIITLDSDRDGITDANDLDNDNDGILDTTEGLVRSSLSADGFDAALTGTVVNNGNNIQTTNPYNGWTASNASTGATLPNTAFNIIRVSGGTYTFGPATAQSGTQYTDINGSDAIIYKQFTITVPTIFSTSAWFSNRDTQVAGYIPWSTKLEIFNTTTSTVVASGNLLQFTKAMGNTQWFQSSIDPITLPAGTYRIRMFVSDYGQVDSITFNIGNDTDGDGIPNYLDLDSDNDGCSDSNEYYNNTTSAANGEQYGQTNGAIAPVGTDGKVTNSNATYSGTYTNAIIATNASITTQPLDKTVSSGATTTFTVGAVSKNTTVFNGSSPYDPNFTSGTDNASNLTYQWEVSTNNGVAWTALSNTGNYSGTTSITLTVTGATSVLNQYQYRAVVKVNNHICTTLTSNAVILKIDSDRDGITDANDLDNDNDGILDTTECTATVAQYFSFFYSSFQGAINTAPPSSNISSISNSTVGNGLTAKPITSNNYLPLTAINATTLAQAITNNEYVEYTFTTNNTSAAITKLGYYSGGSDPTLNSNYQYAARISDDNFVSNTILHQESSYTPGLGNIEIPTYVQNYRIASNKTYKIRVYFFNVTGGATASIQHDDFKVFGLLECDRDGDGIPNIFDLDSDNDGCSDSNEYYNSTSAAANGQQYGQNGGAIAAVGTDGKVTAANYTGSYTNVRIATNASITTQPVDKTIVAGQTTTFTVEALSKNTTVFNTTTPFAPDYTTGTDNSSNLTYQWEVSTNNGGAWTALTNAGVYTGTTTNTLTITGPTTTSNNYQYRAIVKASNHVCTTLTSGAAILKITVCYKAPVLDNNVGSTLDSMLGISSLPRAGATSTWPTIRKSGWIVLEAKTKGFVINRVKFNASSQPVASDGTTLVITNPVEGMMVFDTTNNCLKVYTTTNGTDFAWYCMETQTCPE